MRFRPAASSRYWERWTMRKSWRRQHSPQVPLLIELAKKRGGAVHAGPGENIWSNVHIDDLVALYALAIEKAPAGAFFFVEHGENSMREVCVAINRMLGFVGAPSAMS